MKIDVVIPSYENLSGLRRLLASILRVNQISIENIYVILNPANQKIEQILTNEFSKLLPLKIIQSEQVGVNSARNIGLNLARAEVILFLDDDEVIEDPQFFQRHRFQHLRNPQLICLGGTYELAEPTGWLSRAYHQVQLRWLMQGEALIGTNYHLLGGHISIKKKIFAHFLFDESILFGGAETEFFSRLMKSGVECRLDSSLSILHFHNLDFESFLRKAYLQGKTHRQYSFLDTTSIQRKILHRTYEEKSFSEIFAQKIYFLAFNFGRRNIKLKRPGILNFKNLFLEFRRQMYWFSLKLDFLTKKIDKPRSPDT